MAVRFAGDFFGIPLATEGSGSSSSLLQYFPELKSIKKPEKVLKTGAAESVGGTKAVSPFVGFKTMEASGKEQKAAPIFTGFKAFEQPRETKTSK